MHAFVIAAYEVLSDPDKRKKYDQFGEAAFSQDGGGAGGFQDFNMNDFFKGFDSAFHAHNQGGHGGDSFTFTFGGGQNSFNFDNMFSDDDGDDFIGGNTFMNMGFDDDPWAFGNDFDDGFGFNSIHDAHQMHSHQSTHQRTHQHAHQHAHQQASHMHTGGGGECSLYVLLAF